MYVADARNHAIRKVSRDGAVSTLAGSGRAGYADGAAADAQFDYPFGLAIDGAGNILCADENNHSIRKVSVDGVVSTLAGRQPSRRGEVAPSLGATAPAPAPASPAESLAQKVGRIKAALELPSSLSFRQALIEANGLMGLQPAAAEPLPTQADALLAAIGV